MRILDGGRRVAEFDITDTSDPWVVFVTHGSVVVHCY